MSYNNYEDISVSEAKELLRKWRENNERRSDEVVEIWYAIMDKSDKLGNELYLVLEQVFFAALDVHAYSVADVCVSFLKLLFPGSVRVMRYEACQHEAMGEYSDAMVILQKIIQMDETNSAARKQQIAIWKSLGNIEEAIGALVDYLKHFMSDVEAWQELCELYLRQYEYSKAVFCAEELLLHQPHNNLFHQLVADIRYTMGGSENMELAKTYYCQALKLNPDNMRATLGLVLVTNQLLSTYKSSGNSNKRKDAWKLSQWASSAAIKKQKESGSSLTEAIQALSITE